MRILITGAAGFIGKKLARALLARGTLMDRHGTVQSIREITLSGPGAGGIETASAVIADMVSVVGTTGTGFLENDACWRTLERLPLVKQPALVLRLRETCGHRSTSTSRSTTARAFSPTLPSGWPRTTSPLRA